MDRKEKLIRRLFQWHRELGFQQFHEEFFTCREAKRLFPNPAERTRQLWAHWLTLSEDEYPGFRSDFESMNAVEVAAELKALKRQLVNLKIFHPTHSFESANQSTWPRNPPRDKCSAELGIICSKRTI